MQEFLLFFQEEAGQGGGIGPIGKAADEGGALFQGPGSQPKLNITASTVPGCTYCKRLAWLSQ